MPKRSPTKCNAPHCHNLTHDTYCDTHAANKQADHRYYKQHRQDKQQQSFYSTTNWIKLRNYKRMTQPLCEHCLLNNRATPMDIVDHIIEIKDDWSLRLSLSNLQSLCQRCHNIKTSKAKRQRQSSNINNNNNNH